MLSYHTFPSLGRQENVASPEESSAPLSACSSSRRDSESLYLEVSFEFDSKISGTLQAKRGDVVCQINAINGWLLVRAEDGREGYIPAGYCSPYVSEQAEESSPSATAAGGLSVMSISSGIGPSIGNSQSREDGLRDSDSARQDTPDIQNLGTAIAVFDFLAERTTEVSMLRGDRMTVVSDGDPDWLRVLTEEGLEGLVPKSYVFRPARSEGERLSILLYLPFWCACTCGLSCVSFVIIPSQSGNETSAQCVEASWFEHVGGNPTHETTDASNSSVDECLGKKCVGLASP